jgi:hypothetical protein
VASILAVGVYMAGQPNTARHVMHALAESRQHSVEQRWIALAPDGRGDCALPGTRAVVTEPTPKFTLLDRLVDDARAFDWLLVSDDDVELGPGFLDGLIGQAVTHDLALCQPARSTDSFTDHPIVQVMPGLSARRTRFVEIGPLFCMRRDAMELLLPFGDPHGMGWGLDLIWPARLEQAGLRLGIVDATPVAHRIRRQLASYAHGDASHAMAALMQGQPHLTMDEAFTVLEAYP